MQQTSILFWFVVVFLSQLDKQWLFIFCGDLLNVVSHYNLFAVIMPNPVARMFRENHYEDIQLRNQIRIFRLELERQMVLEKVEEGLKDLASSSSPQSVEKSNYDSHPLPFDLDSTSDKSSEVVQVQPKCSKSDSHNLRIRKSKTRKVRKQTQTVRKLEIQKPKVRPTFCYTIFI